MLTVDGAKVGFSSATTTKVATFIPEQDRPKAESPGMGLLNGIVLLAATSPSPDNFVERDVTAVYAELLRRAKEAVTDNNAASEWCAAHMDAPLAEELTRAAHAQGNIAQVAQLRAQPSVVITRGTDPVQAKAILQNVTFGGQTLDPAKVAAPSDKAADVQTGFGSKDTADGRIEEWSIGMLMGFATDGFMLIAEADTSRMTLPRSDHSAQVGERGACGYATAGLRRVAIAAEGRASGADPVDTQLSALRKAVGNKRIDLLDLLRKAAATRLATI
jgi:hypothetical protein